VLCFSPLYRWERVRVREGFEIIVLPTRVYPHPNPSPPGEGLARLFRTAVGAGRNPVKKNTPRSGQNLGVASLAWDI